MVYESYFHSLLKMMSKIDPILRFKMYLRAKMKPRCAGGAFDNIILPYLGPKFPYKVFKSAHRSLTKA